MLDIIIIQERLTARGFIYIIKRRREYRRGAISHGYSKPGVDSVEGFTQ